MGIILSAQSKYEARQCLSRLPTFIQPSWKNFVDKTSSYYIDYSVNHDGRGGYIFKSVKPGKVPGSRAEYYKELNSFGETTACYKITYDNHGGFVHRKEKM
jgi:hypothetical protein